MANNNLNQRPAKASGDKEITSANRPKMGTSAYGPVDGPRSSDFRMGFMEAKPGMDKGEPILDGIGGRKQVMQESLGPRFAPAITHRPGFVPNGDTQRNTRIVPSVMGNRDAFWAQ
jgi:hypothetical protein